MSYRRSFRYLHTHVLCERALAGELDADRDAVYSALRAGHAYIAMDELHPARGFGFWADGDGHLIMGDEASVGDWELRAELPHPARVRLLRDGEQVASAPHTTSLSHRATEPGVYRVEAFLRTHGRDRTWVLSNPIYLR